MTALEAWLAERNHSLFAHGFEPVGAAGWEAVRRWMERFWLEKLWPALGGPEPAPPLPTSLSGLTKAL